MLTVAVILLRSQLIYCHFAEIGITVAALVQQHLVLSLQVYLGFIPGGH